MLATETLPLDPYKLRADFPILASQVHGDKPLVYLDNAASTQRPSQVIDTLTDVYQRQYANVHRGIHSLSEQCTDLYEEARNKVAAFLNARDAREVIFTTGTTGAINTVARSWGDEHVGPGDEVLLTLLEHHSNIVPWQQLAERTGCTIKFAPISDDGQLEMEAFAQVVNERTKLVAVTAVSNVLGTSTPVHEIVRQAHAVGAIVVLDAAQLVPHDRLDVQDLDADFVAFSGHKMLGPSGVGVLYGREQCLGNMPPFLGGGSMIHRVTVDGYEPGELPSRFEAGTPPIVPALGLASAIDYLEQIGLDKIRQYEQWLTRRAHAVLEEVGSVQILGPSPEHKSGIVSFVVDGIHAHDVAQVLDRQGIAVRAGHHCAMPLHKRLGVAASNRASFYFYNTPEEIDQLGPALRKTKQMFRRR